MARAIVKSGLVAVALLTAIPGAMADAASPPVIEHEAPQPVPPVTSGPVRLTFTGHDLAADLTQNHEDYTQYTHIWVRAVSADNNAGAWTLCQSSGCRLVSGGDDSLLLEFDGARWASHPGSHIQLHFWKGFNTAGTPEPVGAGGAPVSPWSRIVTWDIGPATASGSITMGAPAAPPPAKALVKRAIVPNIPAPPTH